MTALSVLQAIIPFAIVGSERNVIIDGKPVRGRKNRWGVINVEDENHCEFVYLRNFLTRFVRSFGRSSIAVADFLQPSVPICKTSLRRPLRSIMRPSVPSSFSRSRIRLPRVTRKGQDTIASCFQSTLGYFGFYLSGAAPTSQPKSALS